MIQLIRVYRDDQIQPIHVETFYKYEPVPITAAPHRTDCRCLHLPSWTDYYNELAVKYRLGRKLAGFYFQRYEFGRIDMEWIYPTPIKEKE